MRALAVRQRFKVKSMRIKSFVLWFLAFILAAFLMHLFIDEMKSPTVSSNDFGFAGSVRISLL